MTNCYERERPAVCKGCLNQQFYKIIVLELFRVHGGDKSAFNEMLRYTALSWQAFSYLERSPFQAFRSRPFSLPKRRLSVL